MESKKSQYYGMLAEFSGPDELYEACRRLQEAQFRYWEAHSPFPIEKLEEFEEDRGTSILSWIVFLSGLLGVFSAFAMQGWMSGVDYPLVISGKPFFDLPAFIPIAFEMMILFAALGAVVGMFWLNGLPKLYHPLFRSERFERVTDDKFFLSVEARDPHFDEEELAHFFEEIGAQSIELIEW